MIAVARSRQLERFCRQVGGHRKLQAIECESGADTKAQYATDGLPPNWSRQVINRVRRAHLFALAEFPIHVAQNSRRSRVAVMRTKAHEHAAGGQEVILCCQDGGLEYPQCGRVAMDVRT